MNELEKRHQRTLFTNWKKRVTPTLKPYIIDFFSNHNNTEMARKLGRIIEALNNPYYDITDDYGKRLDETSVVAVRVLLEIEVEQFIEYMKNN